MIFSSILRNPLNSWRKQAYDLLPGLWAGEEIYILNPEIGKFLSALYCERNSSLIPSKHTLPRAHWPLATKHLVRRPFPQHDHVYAGTGFLLRTLLLLFFFFLHLSPKLVATFGNEQYRLPVASTEQPRLWDST